MGWQKSSQQNKLDSRSEILQESGRFRVLINPLSGTEYRNTHMNTRLRLASLAIIFGLLTPVTSLTHAQVLAPTGGIDVPNGTRKCIKPPERAPIPTDLLVPLVCLEPVVNVSATTGNQAESFVNVNPTNTNNLVATSNTNSTSIFRAYSTDAGATWTRGTVATGVACCDGQAAWDSFGNLFLVYINSSVNQINVILSTDGGATFSAPVTAGTGSVDQPSIAVGNGSVWVDWNQSGSMVARGAPVTGLGAWGPFNAQQAIPSATGSFGGIAVGPGPNGGKVIVTYQSPTGGQGPATIFANVDADGLGAGGFGARITVTSTNVGGFDFIPAQSGRSIDAEAGLVWDATGGPFNNRIYLVYTDETVNENNDTDIMMRTSTDDGATWTAPVRVNDDATTNSQFLPYVTLDSTSGTVAVGFHDCRNDNGVPGPGGTNMIPNDDAEYYGTFSTDGGATWAPNRRLSGGFSNAAAAGNGIDFGDYVGLDARAGKLYAMWADNANCDGTNPNGTLHQFDLYADPLMLTAGTPSPTPTGTPSPTPTSTPTPTPTPTCPPMLFENFDGVTPPMLPSGWMATQGINMGGFPFWVTSNSGDPMPSADSPPNAAYTVDPANLLDNRLDTPAFTYTAPTQLTFRQNFDLEQSDSTTAFDCGVLEFSNDNGATFTDIITAGGSFVTGGYDHTAISTGFMNPCLPSRPNWSGVSGGFITTTVNLPASGIGQLVKLRWRMCSDSSVTHTGWRLDNVSISGPCGSPTPTATPTATATATATPTVTPTATATATATPRPTPTPRPAPSPRPRPTPAPRP